MLSSINGFDLLLVFIIIGVGYYASICSSNYDITQRKLDEVNSKYNDLNHQYHMTIDDLNYVNARLKATQKHSSDYGLDA